MEKKIFKGLVNRNQIFAFFQFSKFCQNVRRWSFTIILTNYNILTLGNLPAKYEAPTAGGFREEVENVKIWFLSHSFMTNVGGATNT